MADVTNGRVIDKVTTANLLALIVIGGTMAGFFLKIAFPDWWSNVVVAAIIIYLFGAKK